MNNRIKEILAQITALEDEVEDILHARQEEVIYRLKDGKIRLRKDIEAAQRKFRTGTIQWLLETRPQNLATAPFIYGMIVPFALLDLCISLYQAVCFPLYGINKVKRRNYIIIDRHHLGYLNIFEKFHCVYCGYANGLLGYAREIAARTEQYWCPIKHASRVLDKHTRYHNFVDYGDAEAYQTSLARLQKEAGNEQPHTE
jgi:hypothetical protein